MSTLRPHRPSRPFAATLSGDAVTNGGSAAVAGDPVACDAAVVDVPADGGTESGL